jgi:hypothetical protein
VYIILDNEFSATDVHPRMVCASRKMKYFPSTGLSSWRISLKVIGFLHRVTRVLINAPQGHEVAPQRARL